MKGIVWYEDRTRGEEQFNGIIERYKTMGINPIKERKSRYENWVQFENDDFWRLVKATESGRGQRCNISYIDRDIEEIVVNTIIKPCTLPFPYFGYNYY